jgi:putative oxidoreductase
MKKLPAIVAVILGILFLMASVPILFGHMTPPPMPEGTPAAHFAAAFWSTGYVKFVKVFEFTGALVVMIPRLRNIGLLLLGPVIVNIIAYHLLIGDPKELANPMMIMPAIIILCMLYLLWDARRKFAGLLN